MSDRKAVYLVGRNVEKTISDGKHVNSLMEEQNTMQQEMMLKHKQDSEADMLGQSFISYLQ